MALSFFKADNRNTHSRGWNTWEEWNVFYRHWISMYRCYNGSIYFENILNTRFKLFSWYEAREIYILSKIILPFTLSFTQSSLDAIAYHRRPSLYHISQKDVDTEAADEEGNTICGWVGVKTNRSESAPHIIHNMVSTTTIIASWAHQIPFADHTQTPTGQGKGMWGSRKFSYSPVRRLCHLVAENIAREKGDQRGECVRPVDICRWWWWWLQYCCIKFSKYVLREGPEFAPFSQGLKSMTTEHKTRDGKVVVDGGQEGRERSERVACGLSDEITPPSSH